MISVGYVPKGIIHSNQRVFMLYYRRKRRSGMSKSSKKIAIAFIAMLCIAGIIIGGYYFFMKGNGNGEEKANVPDNEIEKLLDKDLETKYPATPTEVVKLYFRFNKCMYNTSMNDKNFEGLLKQLRLLYADEFLADKENSWDDMLRRFKSDRNEYQNSSRTISLYNVEANSSVEYTEKAGKEYATVEADVMVKEKSERTQVKETFMCVRENSKADWKILGWKKTEENKQ